MEYVICGATLFITAVGTAAGEIYRVHREREKNLKVLLYV